MRSEMLRKRPKRIVTIFVHLLVSLSLAFSFSSNRHYVYGDEAVISDATENETVTYNGSYNLMVFDSTTEPSYSEIKQTYQFTIYDKEALHFALDTELVIGDTVDVSVFAPADGLYEIWLDYENLGSAILPSEMSLTIDGEIPFYQLRQLKFESRWMTTEASKFDRYGNEIAASPESFAGLIEKGLNDSAFHFDTPFLFSLSKGEHTLRFILNDGALRLGGVSLRSPAVVSEYVHNEASGCNLIIVEGENIAERNVSSIRAAAEFNSLLTPYNSDKKVLNYLDDRSFSSAGNRVTYDFTVEESGYYNLSLFMRQSAKTNFPVFCNLEIDNVTPSREAIHIPFAYTSSFKTQQVKTSDEGAQSFYLEKGDHTLSITISIELLTPVYEEINALLREINGLSLEIVRLTGGVTTDKYRDYKLDDTIPGLGGILSDWADRCDDMLKLMKQYAINGNASAFSNLSVCSAQLRSLAKKPGDLPRRMNELSKGASSVTRYLSQQLQDMNVNALGIDRIYIHQRDVELPKPSGTLNNMREAAIRFFKSFGEQDYAAQDSNKENLQIWIARPRQYAEVLQNMIDTEFTEHTGIAADVSLMPDQSKLVLANASGKAPDLALSVQYVLPSYLSIREALYDLKQFDNFQEVAKRFPEGLFIPGIVEDGVYGLPETMNFWVMFYRNDIFQALDIPVPDNMDEVKAILADLQRRNMNFFYPTAGMIGLKVFPGTLPIILQSGGSIYGKEIGRTALDTEKSLAGFKSLTELFTIYNMPKDVPAPGFYQQFRDGTLPIGISDFATYNLLLNAAPELSGLWSIALFPGMVSEDGTVLRYTTGGAESDIMFRSTKRPDDAWAFLDWWSSAETQEQYGNTIRSTYGQEFIWNTANIEAFANLPLQAEHKKVIAEQMEWMTEAPWTPGTYMIERELSNAYVSVVVDGTTYRRAMDTAVKKINREIFRKLEEFGYYKDGVMIKQYPTPNIKVLWEE